MRRLPAVLAVLAVLGLPGLLVLPAAQAAAQQRTQQAVPQVATQVVPGAGAGVLVIGVGGLRWDDVGPQTPALARLARTAALGVLSVKARPAVSCAADGWLTLGAGTRADSFGPDSSGADRSGPAGPGCREGLAVGDELRARNADTVDGARLGALAEALDGRYEASGPGAVLALQGPGSSRQPAVVADLGTLEVDDRDAGLRRIDAAVADAVGRLPAGTDLLVVGLSAATGERTAHLQVAMATGPSFPPGALRSASTRRAPYVQLVDVAPTVLAVLGEPVPTVMDGQPWQVDGPAPSIAELLDLDRRAQGQRAATVPFFVVLAAVPLALLLLLRRRPRAAELVALTTTAGLGASYLANLVPWWRAGVPLLGLLAAVLPIALALAGSALLVARRWPGGTSGVARPAQVVCGLVAAVLVGDLLTGAALQMSSVAGYSPLVAGRFAGIGNVAFGVLAASALLAASAAHRAATLGATGALVVAVDGAPGFGSDVGGVLALVPAFVLLLLLRTGTPVTVGRLARAGAGAALVVTGFALADWSRAAPDRTHLGRLVQDVLDGTAGELLSRKASSVLELLFLSPVTALVPVAVAVAAYGLLRPPAPLHRAFEAAPGWRQGLLAVGLASLLGLVLNDSGAAVPALALGVAVPATAAVVARARQG